MTTPPGICSKSQKKVLIVDPAREGDKGTAMEIARLIKNARIVFTLDSPFSPEIKNEYFCAAIVLTDHTNITKSLHEKLLDLSNSLRTIAFIERTKQGNACVTRLLKEGQLYDFHTLPLDTERLRHTIGHLRGLDRLDCESAPAHAPIIPQMSRIIGNSPALDQVRNQIAHYAKTDLPVLITGESGTGKELTAHEIHARSERAAKKFLAINCATIPHSLAATELFGHEKGAFTDACAARPGRFEQASGGTLFLDEISELSLDIQSQLLRILEDGCLYRIGSHEVRQTDVRIIAASNIDLEKAVKAGRFRFDLFHRLNVLPLGMPPLRDRENDALLLARRFIEKAAEENGRPALKLSQDAEQIILSYRWPGNVRQLQNAIFRAVTLGTGEEITSRDLGLGAETMPRRSIKTLASARADTERALVQQAIRTYSGNISRAAHELGVSRVGLYRLLKRHALDHRKMLNGGADHEGRKRS